MKTLKFTTSHGDFALMDGAEQIDLTLKAFLDEYTPVSKVSEMTEEQFKQITEYAGSPWYGHKDFTNPHNWFPTAKESFESLVTSLGWYLWRNPVQESIASLSENEQAYRHLDTDWKEAESKTLFKPILLKKI